MKNYVARLNAKLQEMKNYNLNINDITFLYSMFVENKRVCYENYIWHKELYEFLKSQYNKRKQRADFDRKMFSKIIFNNLYSIRQNTKDLVPFYADKGSDLYNHYASHQFIRKELEKMSIDDIIVLSYELSKVFRQRRG